MDQQVNQMHENDKDGNPAGGTTTARGIDIKWQDGPLAVSGTRMPPNGAFVEGVINAAIGRLEYYQSSKFRCRENAIALTKLQEANHWLNSRTKSREDAGVEGTHKVRSSEGQSAAAGDDD